MRCSSVHVLIKSARWLGLGALLAALPLSLSASLVTVDFNFSLDSLPGVGSFTYDTSLISTAGGLGPYTDTSDGLSAFSFTYDGNTYNLANALDTPTLPIVFLPTNIRLQHGLSTEFFGLWVLDGSGSCTGTPGSYTCGTGASIIAFDPSAEVLLAEGVTTISVTASNDNVVGNLGAVPTAFFGTLSVATPEPEVLPLLGFGLLGLWFARRRKAIRG